MEQKSVEFGGYRLSVEVTKQVSYALALGRVPVVQGVTLSSSSADRLSGVTLEMWIESVGIRLTEPWIRNLPHHSALSVPFQEVNFSWISGAMFDIQDTQNGELVVAVSRNESAIASTRIPLTVAPPHAWIFSHPNSRNALAAFVRPNDPRLRPILDRASAILLAERGDAGLSGYQDPSHVIPMVGAIYRAVQELGIVYSDPPSSWDLPGQKIRSTERILEEKVGTCLDTAILFAALFENVGLYPQIALHPGHAYVGFWTTNENGFIPSQPSGPLRTEINDLDMGRLLFFETTVVTKRDEPVSFVDAVSLGRRHISDYATQPEGDKVSIFVDVVALRRVSTFQVLAMPTRVLRPDGTVELVEYTPEEFTVNLLLDKLTQELSGRQKGFSGLALDVPPRLKTWLDSLLDLSLRNPLINFRRGRSSLPLIIPEGALGAVEDILAQEVPLAIDVVDSTSQPGETFRVVDDRDEAAVPQLERMAVDALRDRRLIAGITGDGARKLLRAMHSNARTVLEETGSNGLYLAMGFLRWDAERKGRFGSPELQALGINPELVSIGETQEAKGVKSPLILIPVTITPKNRFREFTLSLDASSPITPNYSLIEKLKRDYEVSLDSLANLQEDSSGVDIDAAFDGIRRAIKDKKLEGFRVDEGAVLGFFDFSTYRLWRDLLDNWRILERAPLFRHLIHSPHSAFTQEPQPSTPSSLEPDVDPDVPEDEVAAGVDLDALIGELPIPTDASQAQAVARAASGETFILQGPPGTGKSQTIANMLAHSLQQGKRMLFVAQKKDALDVVKERLDKVGLGAFTLDLHDKNQSLKAVKAQLLAVLERENNVDAVGFEAALQAYHQAFAPLRKYRERLHEAGAHNESLYNAVDRLLALPGEATLDVTGAFISQNPETAREALHEVLEKVAETGPVIGTAEQNPWSFASEASDFSPELVQTLRPLVDTAQAQHQRLQSDPTVGPYLRAISSREELKGIPSLALPAANLATVTSHSGSLARDARRTAMQSLKGIEEALRADERSLVPLATFNVEESLQECRAALGTFPISRFFALGNLRKAVNRHFAQPILQKAPDFLPTLEELQRLKDLGSFARKDIDGVPGLRVPDSFNVYDSGQRTELLQQIADIDAVVRFVESGADRSEFSTTTLLDVVSDNPAARTALIQWSEAILAVLDALGATSETLDLWCGSNSLGVRWDNVRDALADDLVNHTGIRLQRWLDGLHDLAPLREAGLNEACQSLLSGRVAFSDAPTAFLRGYYSALVDYLMVDRGFNTFDSGPLNAYIQKFTHAQDQLRDALPEVLSAELIGRRGFDLSVKLGAVGDLLAELKKQRTRGGSVRLLLRKHWDLIRRVTPCILAGPDSVVRFIDADLEPFDTVVFDEASMIRVATALGSLGRARSAVIVGDTKQMPPTSVAEAKSTWSDEEDEENSAGEMESILSQVEVARVPEVMLNWHYRSEDESLIAFSNNKYYTDKLLTFPAAVTHRPHHGLVFRHVPEGTFIRQSTGRGAQGTLRTNPVEAKLIVEEVTRRLEDPATSEDSIGIVTLNLPQRKLITELLQDSPNEKIQRALSEGPRGEALFVKNLETVQGTERDVILMSVGFSKNERGVLPLNFGPLNNAGGERRLNVAITRGRKQVIVFSSFTGEDLLNRNPTATGAAQLGEFLRWAQLGQEKDPGTSATQARYVDRHQEDVAEALREQGLAVRTNIGLSGFKVDIAVYRSDADGDALLGILLDGPRWNARHTVSDRDALPITFLTNRMAWPAIERIWLPAWVRNRDEEIARILRVVESVSHGSPIQETSSVSGADVSSLTISGEPLLTQDETPRWDDTSDEDGDGTTQTISRFTIIEGGGSATQSSLDSLLENVDIWRPLQPSVVAGQEYLDYTHDRRIQEVIRDIARQLTEHEGPVHPGRFAKFVGSCFGFSRVAQTRVTAISRVPLPGHKKDLEGFIFPQGTAPAEFSLWRRAGGKTVRPMSEISLVEIANAMVALADVAMGINPEELRIETSRILGTQRTTPAIGKRLEEALSLALKSQRLLQDQGYIKTPNS